MTKILIMGDSWACGEWGRLTADGDPVLLHPGTAEYLRDAGHRVTSTAQGGDSNWAQLASIQSDPARLRGQELIVWFITDPLRDLACLGRPQPATLRDYGEQRLRLLGESRRIMRQAWSGPVWLVGGVEPVPTWFCDGVSGWQTLCADWTRWLVPHAQVSGPHLNRTWRYPHCDRDLSLEHQRCEERAFLFQSRAEQDTDTLEHQWFWPDGTHPNREAHRRLCHELILPLL